MHYNADQVMRGIVNYANDEIINKLPTFGKWVVGTGMAIATEKASEVVESLQHNGIVKMLDIVDEDGNIDVEELAHHMMESADKYGKAYIEIPLIGSMSFSAKDIETLKNYIVRA